MGLHDSEHHKDDSGKLSTESAQNMENMNGTEVRVEFPVSNILNLGKAAISRPQRKALNTVALPGFHNPRAMQHANCKRVCGRDAIRLHVGNTN